MIPKLLHYCWFGGNQLSQLDKRCIESWKKNCPDFKIICWNENNYDINTNWFVREAYRKRKWAFVSDYVRLDVIYKFGGVYLDTDVELIKELTPLLKNNIYMGLEKIQIEKKGNYWINTGLGFGAEGRNALLKDIMDIYENITAFNRSIFTPSPMIITNFLREKGIKDQNMTQMINDLIIYPTDFFSPKNFTTKQLEITSNTYSIHHYQNSWNNDCDVYKRDLKSIIWRLLTNESK